MGRESAMHEEELVVEEEEEEAEELMDWCYSYQEE